jgi:hypothetical protein
MHDAAGTEAGGAGRWRTADPAGPSGQQAGHVGAVPPHPVQADLPWRISHYLANRMS